MEHILDLVHVVLKLQGGHSFFFQVGRSRPHYSVQPLLLANVSPCKFEGVGAGEGL